MDSGIEIGFREKAPRTLNELLAAIFWKKKSLAHTAHDFLDYILEWSRTESPYTVNEWKRYCIKNNLSQSTYHNMLRRLRRAGLIEKRYNRCTRVHELHISHNFSETLEEMAQLWNRYLTE